MSSVAQRKRARKTANQIKAQAPKALPASLITHGSTSNVERFRQKTGLEWLATKGKITARQAKAGRRYGSDFRIVAVAGMEPLRSCLNDNPRGGEGSLGLSLADYEMTAKESLAQAQAALHFHPEMILACDMICGRDMTPWELIARHGGGQRDAERITNSLRIALDILAKHYGG